jgi:CubicO group peptidase (beta-lactamase class C family)
MAESPLQEALDALVEELEVPGVAVGVLHDGVEHYAYSGVTCTEHPLPVDAGTLFQFGSTGKTYTASALMRLADQGRVDLDAPVRTYLPELALRDEDVAARVTVLQLLNHTAGWEGDMMDNTGDGDDALEKYVAKMVDIQQVTPLGASVSYNNAALSVAGLVIARVCGTTYEQAIRDLLLEPLGLDMTFFFPTEIMTRRFAVGHNQHPDGTISIARPWAMPRGNAPAGGMSATARDQIAWARFHLGDGTAVDGTRVLEEQTLLRMQQPTAQMPGSALGDAVGISWLLGQVGGVRTVGHGGTTNGQHSDFTMVPERGFAVTSLSNCGPNGPQLNKRIVAWALEHHLGVVEQDVEPVSLSPEELAAYVGSYETIAAEVDVVADGGRLAATIRIKPAMLAALRESGEEAPEQPPVPLALLPGDGDRYVVPEGDGRGMKGYFTRGADGTVDGVHLGGRLATRTAPVPA